MYCGPDMLTSSLSALDPKPSLAVQFFALRYSLFDHLVGEREQRGWHGTDYDIAGLAHCGDDEFTPIMLSPARWMRFGGKKLLVCGTYCGKSAIPSENHLSIPI